MIDPKQILCEEGRRQAKDLQTRSPTMTGTEIIAQEHNVPAWDGTKDYSGWETGWPVSDEGQVWTLLIPHNAASYPGVHPSGNRACWGLAHTTDPALAKPWVAPCGTSGLYGVGECCVREGKVWRNLYEGNPYPPQTQGAEDRWQEVV